MLRVRAHFPQSVDEPLGSFVDLGVCIVEHIGRCPILRVVVSLRTQGDMLAAITLESGCDTFLVRIYAEACIWVLIIVVGDELVFRELIIVLLQIGWRLD